jgi:hypothetical protein
MGIRHMSGVVSLIEKAMIELGLPMPLVRVCECGDQRIHIFRHTSTFFQSSRTVYEFFGGLYVSIDLNGKYGALTLDLGKPLLPEFDESLLGTFNLVTNFGTIEHVRENQCQAFANLHDLCDVDGLMVHCMPHVSFVHGDWQYTTEWVEHLADAQGYKVVSMEVTDKDKIWNETPPNCRPHGWTRNMSKATYVNCILRKVMGAPFDIDAWVEPTKAPTPGKVWSKPDGTKQ